MNNINTGPTATWATTDSTTKSGVFTIRAISAAAPSGTAAVTKWCLTKDGSPITTDVRYSDYSNFGYATFNSDTGCWTNNSGITAGTLSFDSTKWADGSHTFVLTVTDSSARTATSSTLTVNNINTGPTVTWATTNNTTKSGVFTISAISAAAPSGTATVTKWCLTKDGSPITTDVRYSDYSNFGYATFNPNTGCWTNNSGITSGSFSFNSAAWTNELRTYVLTASDSSGRTASTNTLDITTSNPQPTVQLTVGAAETPNVSNVFISMYHPGASGIKSVCFKLNNSQCSTGSVVSSKDATTKYGATADTRMLPNGNYTVSASITDTENRLMDGGSSVLVVSNPAASATALVAKAVAPSWNQKTVSVEFSALFNYATNATVFWGTNLKKLLKKQFPINNWNQSTVNIGSLKPNTIYYFKTSVIGPNGSSTSQTIKLKTPKIPARPRSTYSGGSSGGGGSGGSYPFVVGMRLDQAMRLSNFDYQQYPACFALSGNYENGFFGVLNKSNWQVVGQSGSLLQVCKRK